MNLTLLFLCITFGLGLGLIFFGLVNLRKKNRFQRDFNQAKRTYILDFLKPLTYLKPMQYWGDGGNSLSLLNIEELLHRAGHPWGIKARHVLIIRLLLPLVAIGAVILYYGLQGIINSVKTLTLQNGVAIKNISAGRMPLFLAFMLAMIAFYAPVFILRLLGKNRRKQVVNEQGLFSEVVFMSLKANLSLKEAVEEAIKTTVYLKPYLQVCLNEWLTDKIIALNNLKKNVGVPSFQLIIDLLMEAANAGDNKISDFLEENKRLEDEIKSLEVSAQSKMRPLILTFQMILPFFVILIVLFYPLVAQVEQIIWSF